MRFTYALTASLLATFVSAQNGTTKFHDPQTGITFASYMQENGVAYRIALPKNSSTSDAIFQISSPSSMAWCGLAWGGHMTNNPLSVAWATNASDGAKAVVSSRFAYTYYSVPQPYDSAVYTVLHTASSSSGWSITARCEGCTKWTSTDGDVDIQNSDNAQLAYGCSSKAPATPNSNSSSFGMHEVFAIWQHDFSGARNESYGAWIKGVGEVRRRWVA